MVRSEEKSSNLELPSDPALPDFDALFAELKDWEAQLRHIEFDKLDFEDDETGEEDGPEPPRGVTSSKRGGPSPC